MTLREMKYVDAIRKVDPNLNDGSSYSIEPESVLVEYVAGGDRQQVKAGLVYQGRSHNRVI
jgi:hypothetical protein